ncbi:MAG: endolytic transglycosylase MltG [Candidatus Gottesmanbacteria bacterium]|nr:endolytic transglycosylase MltG [Candidatus Gottesmanbacteria bacterium]
MHKWLVVKIIISAVVILVSVFLFFGPPASWREQKKETEVFVVPKTEGKFDAAGELKKQGFVRSEWMARLVLAGETIEPGGYRLNKGMWLWQVTHVVTNKPSLLWVTITGCLRREQIGEMLAGTLSWDQTKLDQWNSAYKSMEPDYVEGVYYPDTYLIPVDETGDQVAKRFIDRFNEKFAPFSQKFLDANIRWVTALKIASLIEREAGGESDMKLISGIIWNRLNTNMLLQIDATMQYTRGKKPDPSAGSGQAGSWWGGIDLAQMKSDSPYNTYLYKGLPPTPICSPSITSIEAVLNPEETDCLYYLHDKKRQIHCAATYAEHKQNIQRYLQ